MNKHHLRRILDTQLLLIPSYTSHRASKDLSKSGEEISMLPLSNWQQKYQWGLFFLVCKLLRKGLKNIQVGCSCKFCIYFSRENFMWLLTEIINSYGIHVLNMSFYFVRSWTGCYKHNVSAQPKDQTCQF